MRIGLELKGPTSRKLSKQPRALSRARNRENAQVVRAIASIVIIFAVCMFPKHLARLYFYIGENSPRKAQILFRMLHLSEIFALIHSCLNPLVYGTVLKHFRAEYAKYLKGIFCCRWSSSLGRVDFTREFASNSVDSASSKRSSRTVRSDVAMCSQHTTAGLTTSPSVQLSAEIRIENHITTGQGSNTTSNVDTKL